MKKCLLIIHQKLQIPPQSLSQKTHNIHIKHKVKTVEAKMRSTSATGLGLQSLPLCIKAKIHLVPNKQTLGH